MHQVNLHQMKHEWWIYDTLLQYLRDAKYTFSYRKNLQIYLHIINSTEKYIIRNVLHMSFKKMVLIHQICNYKYLFNEC
jgi:hypothetical protein